MTKTQELLEAVRVKHGGATDYKLAKVLDIARQDISHYMKGTRNADAYTATRIALALKKDPLEVIASIEAENASTEAKRAFWRGFPSGLRRTALGAALLAICGTSALAPRVGQAASLEPTSYNGRLRQRRQNVKSHRLRAFFSSTVDLDVELQPASDRDRRRPGRPA